jgi:hypothetical protein
MLWKYRCLGIISHAIIYYLVYFLFIDLRESVGRDSGINSIDLNKRLQKREIYVLIEITLTPVNYRVNYRFAQLTGVVEHSVKVWQ